MNDNIREWLAANKRDRAWLAEKCGVSKRTVDGWFSSDKDMPKMAEELVKRIMEENSFGSLEMGFEDWQLINAAMKESGYSDFGTFALHAIKNYAAEHQDDGGKSTLQFKKPKTKRPPSKKKNEKAG